MITTATPTTRTDKRITHSEKQCFNTCKRKDYLAYELGLRPDRTAKPLRIGSAVHLGLDYANQRQMGVDEWETKTDQDIIQAVLDKYTEHTPENHEYMDDFRYEVATIAALLAGYFWRWSAMPLDFVASEEKFDLPIINPDGNAMTAMRSAGMMDARVMLVGRMALKETKTTSDDISPESDYWGTLRIDSQISDYYNACLDMGYPIETVLYDVIKKPTIKPRSIPVLDAEGLKQVYDRTTGERVANKNGSFKQSVSDKETQYLETRKENPSEFTSRILDDIYERPDFYYARKEIPRLQDDLDEARYEHWQVAKSILESRRHGRWPRNTGACKNFNTKCPYYELCRGNYKPGDAVQGFVYVNDVHQELAEVEE